MSLCRLLSVALLPLAVLAAEPPAEDKKNDKAPPAVKALKAGNDLPGPFHPYNVNGPNAGHFHCVVSGQGFDPLVLLFVRDLEVSDPLRKLLQRLDQACVKNPNVRLACAVVFLSDELKQKEPGTLMDDNPVVIDDDKREELAQKLVDLAGPKGLDLQKVVLCLDHKSDVEKYVLAEDAAYTLVLAHKARIVATETIPRDKLDEKGDAIVQLLADKLGAVRK